MSGEEAIAIRDVVTIAHSYQAKALEVAGDEGVVLGVTEDGSTGERWFAVQVGDLPAVMLPAAELTPTGRKISQDEVYKGQKLRISRRGTVLDGQDRGSDAGPRS